MKQPKSNFTFSRVPGVVKPRSQFDRSRTYKSAFDAGYLIPFFWDEVLPGDTFNLDVTAFARLSTPVVPFMDNLYMDFQFFFVPNRLVWENWQRFCGEQDNPDDSTDFLIPQMTSKVAVGSIFDYFGLPVAGESEVTFDARPLRAYNLIWNSFYRDENLQDSVEVPTGDGPDDPTDFALLRRGKRKADPFTSALPWPQKGPGVELPLGGTAAVVGNGNALGFAYSAADPSNARWSFTSSYSPQFSDVTTADQDTIPVAGADARDVSGEYFNPGFYLGVTTNPKYSGLQADLSTATAATINSLREAFQVQKWYEQLARGGSRYVELVLSMFGCHTGDARLQRPEYLGGGKTTIQVHSVAQTSSTDQVTPQGNLAAYGVAGASGIGFSKSFVEHGLVIGLVSVRGDYTYQQGLDRMWSRRTKFDFFWPAFAHLGEVPILNQEIYFSGDADVDGAAFGYQERWYEYRYGINKITGKLRSGVSGSLDVWHLAQYFSQLPTLNSTFIEENPPVSRVLAVQNEPQFIFDSVVKCKCARVMPVYSVPGLVDHF